MSKVGQRVVIRRSTNQDEVVRFGRIAAYLFAVAAADGFVEERGRIVVITDEGSIIFAVPSEVRLEEAARTTQPSLVDASPLADSPCCPEHGPQFTRPSRFAGFYCSAIVEGGRCAWSWKPDKAAKR